MFYFSNDLEENCHWIELNFYYNWDPKFWPQMMLAMFYIIFKCHCSTFYWFNLGTKSEPSKILILALKASSIATGALYAMIYSYY